MDMWSDFFGGVTGYASSQMQASGAVLAKAGNASDRLVAPAGNTRGIPLNGNRAIDLQGSIGGRLSLGFVGAVIVFLGLSYVMSRNVQGGG